MQNERKNTQGKSSESQVGENLHNSVLHGILLPFGRIIPFATITNNALVRALKTWMFFVNLSNLGVVFDYLWYLRNGGA